MSTETESKTTAQVIAGLLDNDGQRFFPARITGMPEPFHYGDHLDDLARAVNGRQSFRDGHGTDTYRWDFADGSAIVVAGDAWDLPLGADPGCYCREGGGRAHGGLPGALARDGGMTDSELFSAAASLLLGERWQRPLARLLDVDDRLVRRWATGDRPVPAWALVRLRQELAVRGREVRKMIAWLPASV